MVHRILHNYWLLGYYITASNKQLKLCYIIFILRNGLMYNSKNWKNAFLFLSRQVSLLKKIFISKLTETLSLHFYIISTEFDAIDIGRRLNY